MPLHSLGVGAGFPWLALWPYEHSASKVKLFGPLILCRIHVLPVELSVKDKLSNIRAISIGLMSDPLLSPAD